MPPTPSPFPLRPFLPALDGYAPGEQMDGARIIKLNTNENPFPPTAAVAGAVAAAVPRLHLYPNATSEPLRKTLAALHNVSPDQILAGNGSDEILRLLVHGFIGKGDALAVVEPTYSLYPILAALYEGTTVSYPLEGLEILPEALFEGPEPLLMIPNPNPPLGTLFSRADIARLCAARAPRMVVIDEAYADFAGRDCVGLLEQFPNLVITRTFSKSYSLAGLRVGYMIAHPALILEMNKIKDSYNVNALSQAAACAAAASAAEMRARCRTIVQTRERTTGTLREMGWRVPESHGNFVFAFHPEARKHYESLRSKNILVRYFNQPLLREGFRVSIGTDEQMDCFLKALAESMET